MNSTSVREITPFDFHSQVRFDVWDIINDFKHKGYYSRKSFIDIICKSLPEKDSPEGRRRLKNFWHNLVNDHKLNIELKEVLIKVPSLIKEIKQEKTIA